MPFLQDNVLDFLRSAMADRVVAGRFRVEREVGAGATGIVYRALDIETELPCAIKILRRDRGPDLERFDREVATLATLVHPGIVRYVTHGTTDEGERYLVMEWLEGETLTERLERGPLSAKDVSLLAARIADALRAPHGQGIVHRDIKPGNLFLSDGRISDVKILDFGLCRREHFESRITVTGVMVGTPEYMAPEQARGERAIDGRADLFSLGSVLYEALTGHRAFGAKDLLGVLAKIVLEDPPPVRDLLPFVPQALEALVHRLLAKSRDERPADAYTVVEEAVRIADDLGATAEKIPTLSGREALTSAEQRFACVIVTRPRSDLPAITTDGARRAHEDDLRALAASVGGELHVLANGGLIIRLPTKGAPTDQAMVASRCAMTLQAELGGAAVAIVASRTPGAGTGGFGEAIDRAVDLLEPDGDSIRIDETIAALLEARFEVLPGPPPTLGAERSPVDPRRMLLGRPTACVGRERVLGQLFGLFDECASEPVARVALVVGEAGIGKSRLRHEVERRIDLERAGTRRLLARGDPMTAGSSLALLTRLVRAAAGVVAGDSPEERRGKLESMVARVAAGEPERVRIASFLGELARVPLADDDRPALKAARVDAQLMADQIRVAFVDWLAAECRAGPVLLTLEDLHWGDRASIALVGEALRHLADSPLMVLGILRAGLLDDSRFDDWSRRGLTRMNLGPIPRRAAAELVRSVLGPSFPEAIVERTVDQSAGNPFLLEELVRAAAGGSLQAVPMTVMAMIESRLDALSPGARRVLRAAAILGPTFSVAGIDALLVGQAQRVSPIAKERDLDELVDRELVERPSRSLPDSASAAVFGFRHALVRDAAYSTLTDDDRRLGHRLAAEWLEGSSRDAPDEVDPVLVAEHFERGELSERASPWYRRAAEQALAANDLDAVFARSARAAACGASRGDLGALRLLEAEAYYWRSDHEASGAAAGEAQRLLERGSARWYMAASISGRAHATLGRLDPLEEVSREIEVLAREGSTLGEAVIALSRCAVPLVHADRRALADTLIACLDRCVAPPAMEHPRVKVSLLALRATLALRAGDRADYVAIRAQVALAAEEVGDFRTASSAWVNVGYGYLELGANEEAERCIRAAMASGERLGLSRVVATGKHNLGLVLARLGSVEEGLRIEYEAVEAFVASGEPRLESGSRMYAGTILLYLGDAERAESEARAAERMTASPATRLDALCILARALAAQGRADEALEAAEQAMSLFEATKSSRVGELRCRLARVEALLAAGRREEAHRAALDGERVVLEQAAALTDARWRRTFVEGVPENARLVALARSLARPATA